MEDREDSADSAQTVQEDFTFPVCINGFFVTLFISKFFSCSLFSGFNLDYKSNNSFIHFHLLKITFEAEKHFLS